MFFPRLIGQSFFASLHEAIILRIAALNSTKKKRQADILIGQGKKIPEVCKEIYVSENTYYRWRQKYGGMSPDMIKQHQALQKENARLRKVIADRLSAKTANPRARYVLERTVDFSLGHPRYDISTTLRSLSEQLFDFTMHYNGHRESTYVMVNRSNTLPKSTILPN